MMSATSEHVVADLGRLENLANAFDHRSRWWNRIISHARKAGESHHNVCKNDLATLKRIENAYKILNNGTESLKKCIDSLPGNLDDLYDDRGKFTPALKNPLQNVERESRHSQSQSGKKFWKTFERLLSEGRQRDAEKLLGRGENWLNRRIISWRHGQADLKEWHDDLDSARAIAALHREVSIKISGIDEVIDNSEKSMAQAVLAIVRQKGFRELIKNPQLQDIIKNVPEFGMVAAYARRDKIPNLRDIAKDIDDLDGRFDPDRLKNIFEMLKDKAQSQIAPTRKKSRESEQRYAAANDFIKSCNVTRRLETDYSLIVGSGLARVGTTDMTGWLRAIITDSYAGHTDRLSQAIAVAEVKQRRWVDASSVEQNLWHISSVDLDVEDVDITHARTYALNALRDSFRRTMAGLGHTAQAVGKSLSGIFSRHHEEEGTPESESMPPAAVSPAPSAGAPRRPAGPL